MAPEKPIKNPRGAGRKPREGGTVPTNLRLTPRERDVLAALGGGDMTAGLRVVLGSASTSLAASKIS